MWDHDCVCLPVVDGPRVVGVVTDRDISMCACTQGRALADLIVDQAMAQRPIVARLDEDVATAESIMRAHRVRRLPVVDSASELVGVLSLSDIARATQEPVRGSAGRDVAATLGAIAAPREIRKNDRSPSAH